MSAPVVIAVEPGDQDVDVILGTPIIVTFDQEIDATTITDATFALTGPGQVERVTAGMTNVNTTVQGRDPIPGTFGFVLNANNQTVLTFTPTRVLQKNTQYVVFVAGDSGSMIASCVRNTAGEEMVNNYQWSFTTGALDITVPPPAAPLPPLFTALDPSQIQVEVSSTDMLRPLNPVVGNDLTQCITLTFPAGVDPSMIVSNLQLSLEPILGDLSVRIPHGLTSTAAVISPNQIQIRISGWPTDEC